MKYLPLGTVVKIKNLPSDHIGYIAYVNKKAALFPYIVIFHKGDNIKKIPRNTSDEDWFKKNDLIVCKGIQRLNVFAADWGNDKITINPLWDKKTFAIGHRDFPIKLALEIANWLNAYHPQVRFARKARYNKITGK